MPDVNTKPKHDTTEGDRGTVPSAERTTRDTTRPHVRVIPLLITLATIALAVPLGWGTWDAYMGAPWTRDGTVRAYVVTMAPEVAGRIIKLPVADNQFVHKGDELFEIDPADYQIALEQAEAQAQRDGAALDYARANEGRQATLEGEGWVSKSIYQQVASTMHQLEAAVAVDRGGIVKEQLDP